MGFFEEMFDPAYMFDNERRQRRDIEALRDAVSDTEQADRIRSLEAQVGQLQLLVNALVSVVEHKKLATREELEILVQQIDLLDGIEDGQMSPQVWSGAPRCQACNRAVNPKRDTCVYCGRTLALQNAEGGPYRGGAPGQAAPERTATCAGCRSIVPQSQTYFTDDGELRCADCFQR